MNSKKIILSETQYSHLMDYINESTNHSSVLVNLLNDNTGVRFISFIKNDNQRINFRLDKYNGHDVIVNIQKGAMYFNAYGDFRPKTMLYGNSIYLNYSIRMVLNKQIDKLEPKEGSWKEVLTNIVAIEIYDANHTQLDSAELDSDTASSEKSVKPVDDIISDYNEQFNNLKVDQVFNLIGPVSYEGVVLEKTPASVTFELANRKNKTKVFTCEFLPNDDAGNPQSVFRKNTDDSIIFTAVKFIQSGLKSSKSPITINGIKDFIVKPKDKSPEELEQDKQDDENAKAIEADKAEKQKALDDEKEREKQDAAAKQSSINRRNYDKSNKDLGKEVFDRIMANPDLKKAFFKQPTLLGFIKTGDPVGIVPAKKLLDNYFTKNSEKQIGEMTKKFPINTTITFEVIDNDLVIKDANNFKATVGKIYKAIVKQREIGAPYIQCVHKANEIDPEFFLNIYPQKEKVDIEDDIYPAKIKMQYLSANQQKYNYPPSEMGKIRVTNYKFN